MRPRRSAANTPGCRSASSVGAQVLLTDVRMRGLTADPYPAWSIDGPTAVARLINNERNRRSAAPIGSDAWLAILATGGVGDFARLLAGTDSS